MKQYYPVVKHGARWSLAVILLAAFPFVLLYAVYGSGHTADPSKMLPLFFPQDYIGGMLLFVAGGCFALAIGAAEHQRNINLRISAAKDQPQVLIGGDTAPQLEKH